MQPKLLKRKRFESRHKKIWNRPMVPCAVPTGLKSSLHDEFLCLKIPHTCHWCGITFSSSENLEKTKWAPTREENLSTLRSLPMFMGKNTKTSRTRSLTGIEKSTKPPFSGIRTLCLINRICSNHWAISDLLQHCFCYNLNYTTIY